MRVASITEEKLTEIISTLFVSLDKQTYDVNYALRLPPDGQIEFQRRTADFRNFFCPSEIDTYVRNPRRKKLSKRPPPFNELYLFAPLTYRKVGTCEDWA